MRSKKKYHPHAVKRENDVSAVFMDLAANDVILFTKLFVAFVRKVWKEERSRTPNK